MMKIGDVVELKSGGCYMVIDSIDCHQKDGISWNEIYCVWHTDGFSPERSGYDERCLKKVVAESEGE